MYRGNSSHRQASGFPCQIIHDALWRNDVFADFINGLIFDGQEAVKPEELENAAPLAVYNSKEGVRSMIHDVVKYWKKAECIIAVFGIENQSWIDPDQVFRDIGYLGTGYRDQLNRKDGKRYPIILITLYCGEKRWNTRRKLSDCFTIPEALKPWFHDHEIKIVNLSELTEEEIDRFHGLIRYIADVFAHRKDRKYRYTKVPIGSEEGWEVIKLINGMNSDMFHNTLQSNYRADTMEGFLSQEEKLKTFAEGKAESICSLMQNHDFSFERAADDLSIPECDREIIRKFVDKMLQERAA